jgi:hypothetical protein
MTRCGLLMSSGLRGCAPTPCAEPNPHQRRLAPGGRLGANCARRETPYVLHSDTEQALHGHLWEQAASLGRPDGEGVGVTVKLSTCEAFPPPSNCPG